MAVGCGTIGSTGVGVCPNHPVPLGYTTLIISGVPTITANAKGVSIIGSIGVSTCGHTTIALTGSPAVLANNIGLHKVGDSGINYGTYILTVGEPAILSD